MKYSKWWKAKTYNKDYSTQQSYHLELKESKGLPRQEKARGIHYHQSSIAWYVRVFFKKEEEEEREGKEKEEEEEKRKKKSRKERYKYEQ